MKSLNKYYNPNPAKKETDDCVVRAICAATGLSWDDVFYGLCSVAFREKSMPNSKSAYTEYLTLLGFSRTPVSNKKGSKRPTVDDMAKRSKKDGGVYICDVANHLVTAKEGAYFDTWESGHKSLYAYWSKN